MNRIEITPDMRSRLLSGITAAVNENEALKFLSQIKFIK